ncbi:MAG TPA: metallophosphoesterase [Candidatus Binatia bacterium]|jgi:hypothetical protein|nr:metallophosphoesterase [Candidatus Binatia bacterium]
MRRAVRLSLVLALWVTVGILGVAHLWGWLLSAYSRERPVLANTALNVSRISIPSGKWKFAVLGDLGKRYEIFSRFLSQMKQDDIRFIILCGDLAYRITPEQYEYLHLKIAQSGFNRPIFSAVGHHDVTSQNDYRLFRRYVGGLNTSEKIQGIKAFFYGDQYPERFAFVVPDRPPFQALFIIFDHVFAPPDRGQFLWIEGLLKNYRSQVRHVFLFSHMPVVKAPKQIQKVPSKEWLMPYERLEKTTPDGKTENLIYELIRVDPVTDQTPLIPLTRSVDPRTGRLTFTHPLLLRGYDRFYELLDRYKVTAIFSGDLHGYARYQIGSTLHFVSGGGGGRLQYPEALHHYLEVEVRANGLNVRPVVFTSKTTLMDRLEQITIVEIFLPFVHRPWLYLLLAIWVGGFALLLRFSRGWACSGNP